MVLKYAEDNNAKKVVSVYLKVGELRDFAGEWLQRYFDYLSRGTIAEGAEMVVERVALQLRCDDCADTFSANLDSEKFVCPCCGSENSQLTAGREFIIESIGVV